MPSEGTIIEVNRFPDVSGLSLRARLAVALHLFRDFCRQRGLSHPEIDRYTDYLWEFIGFYGDPEPFCRWVEQEPPLVRSGLQDQYPQGFEEVLAAARVPAGEFRRVLECCTEVLYTSLWGAADEKWSRHYLNELAKVVVAWGIVWPDLGRFAISCWADDSGWGDRPSEQELSRWRSAE